LKNMAYKIIVACLSILMMLSLTSCGRSLKFYGKFCGRVVDKETNKPIEGVVIIASWETFNIMTEGYSFTRPYKVSEVASNPNGEFCLHGQGFSFFPYNPSVEIFKSGYAIIPTSYYPNFLDNPHYKDSISWDGNKAIVKLTKLSIEDRIKKSFRIGNYIYDYKEFKKYRVLFDKEIALEREELENFREQMRQNELNSERNRTPIYGMPPSVQGTAIVLPYQEGGIPKSDVPVIMHPKNPQRINK